MCAHMCMLVCRPACTFIRVHVYAQTVSRLSGNNTVKVPGASNSYLQGSPSKLQITSCTYPFLCYDFLCSLYSPAPQSLHLPVLCCNSCMSSKPITSLSGNITAMKAGMPPKNCVPRPHWMVCMCEMSVLRSLSI